VNARGAASVAVGGAAASETNAGAIKSGQWPAASGQSRRNANSELRIADSGRPPNLRNSASPREANDLPEPQALLAMNNEQ